MNKYDVQETAEFRLARAERDAQLARQEIAQRDYDNARADLWMKVPLDFLHGFLQSHPGERVRILTVHHWEGRNFDYGSEAFFSSQHKRTLYGGHYYESHFFGQSEVYVPKHPVLQNKLQTYHACKLAQEA